MTTVEGRLSRLEGSYEQISERLNDLNQVVQGVDRKVDALRSDMDARFAASDVRFDSLRSNMDARFESLRSEMDARFRETDGKIDHLGHRVYIIGAAMWTTLAVGLFAIAAGFIG